MRELQDYELKYYYGGSIAVAIGIVTIAAIAVAAYKMMSASEAKVKLPGEVELSFSGAKGSKKEKISSPKRNSQQITKKLIELNQLDNKSQTFTSTPSDFLVKL